jgi:hypothetical protein
LTPARFGLFPFRSPLLRESLLLSSPWGTQMFQFPQFPPLALCVQARVTPHDGCRVSPFGHPRIEAWSAAPRGLTQPPTSFIGFRRQGIHRWLFVAWRTKMLVLAMEFSRGQTAGRPPVSGASHCTPFAGRRDRSLKTEQRQSGAPGSRLGGLRLRKGIGLRPAVLEDCP